jgi:hypothetical protein
MSVKTEIMAMLGKPKEAFGTKFFDENQPYVIDAREDCENFDFKEAGFSLIYIKKNKTNELVGARFHNKHPFLPDFNEYKHSLPFELSFSMTLDELTNLFGEPVEIDIDDNIIYYAKWATDNIFIVANFNEETQKIHTFGLYVK